MVLHMSHMLHCLLIVIDLYPDTCNLQFRKWVQIQIQMVVGTMHMHGAFGKDDCQGACSVGTCSALAGKRSKIRYRLTASILAAVDGDMCI